MRRFAVLALVVAFGCSKTSEEKASKDDEKVEKDGKKKKSKDDTDELTNDEICKKIVKLAKKEKELSDEKVEKLNAKCGKKLDEAPIRKKCAATCVADNDTMEAFEKCDRACRKGKDSDD